MNETVVAPAPLRRSPKFQRVAGVLWRASINFGTVCRIMHLLNLPPFIDAVQDNPKLAFKYLTVSYLMNGLPIRDRAECFLHHYELLYARFPTRALRQILSWGIDLCEFTVGGVRFAVRFGISRPCGKEGEQSLVLIADGEVLYTIAFTFVPGRVTGSKHRQVILVSRIQGEPALPGEKLKAAQAALYRMRFGSLLIAGLEGIAVALGISEIASVSSTLHISYSNAYAARFEHEYDDFLRDKGFSKNESALFVSAIPLKEKANSEIKSSRRSRAKAKRLIRRQISTCCRDYLLSVLQPIRLVSESQPEPAVPVATLSRPERGARSAQQEGALTNGTSLLSSG